MTWKNLKNFLTNLEDENILNQQVLCHNVETGDEYLCETFLIDNDRLVLMFNFNEEEQESYHNG